MQKTLPLTSWPCTLRLLFLISQIYYIFKKKERVGQLDLHQDLVIVSMYLPFNSNLSGKAKTGHSYTQFGQNRT